MTNLAIQTQQDHRLYITQEDNRSLANPQGPMTVADYYSENGYVVIRNVLPPALLDKMVAAYTSTLLPSTERFYRTMNQMYEKNQFNEHGHVKQAFQDVHSYAQVPSIKNAALDIYFSDEMQHALREATGFDSHFLTQSMLFDRSAATRPHQDWWYTDSVPSGHITGVWIALEDIHEKSGRFYCQPRTQKLDSFHAGLPNLTHEEWLARHRQYLSEHREDLHAPAMKKGDIMFFNSGVVHGALEVQDESFSRKSMTGHFCPSHMGMGNLHGQRMSVKLTPRGPYQYIDSPRPYTLRGHARSLLKSWAFNNPVFLYSLRRLRDKAR
jgi:phytanoyl-CoA hydroxylase